MGIVENGQNIGQDDPRDHRVRRIPLRGVKLDNEGVFKFAGEAGGPPGSITLSGERLLNYERREAVLMNEIYDYSRDGGASHEEAKRIAGIE